jgi:hypothetical protein
MAQYLLINRFREGQGPAAGTRAHDVEMAAWGRVNQALRASGDLVWSMALAELDRASACRTAETGELIRDTGRAAAPEGVFALYLVDVADEASAATWAAGMPTAAYGAVEIRELIGEERG